MVFAGGWSGIARWCSITEAAAAEGLATWRDRWRELGPTALAWSRDRALSTAEWWRVELPQDRAWAQAAWCCPVQAEWRRPGLQRAALVVAEATDGGLVVWGDS